MTPQDAPAGPVLGEEARRIIAAVLCMTNECSQETLSAGIVDALSPHVAALVSAAERRGAEGRHDTQWAVRVDRDGGDGYWHYDTEEEAMEAAERLAPSLHPQVVHRTLVVGDWAVPLMCPSCNHPRTDHGPGGCMYGEPPKGCPCAFRGGAR